MAFRINYPQDMGKGSKVRTRVKQMKYTARVKKDKKTVVCDTRILVWQCSELPCEAR